MKFKEIVVKLPKHDIVQLARMITAGYNKHHGNA